MNLGWGHIQTKRPAHGAGLNVYCAEEENILEHLTAILRALTSVQSSDNKLNSDQNHSTKTKVAYKSRKGKTP